MFRGKRTKISPDIFYLPRYTNVQAQDSPLCYYFSYLHLLAYHNLSESIPDYVKTITSKMKTSALEQHKDIIINAMQSNADGLLWVADEMLDDPDASDSDDEQDWVIQFFEKYGIEHSIARLLKLSINDFEMDEVTYDWLKKTLAERGPVALGTTHAADLPENHKDLVIDILQTENSKTTYNLYNVDRHLVRDEAHYVLVIGCQSMPEQRVCYIDPMFPNEILSVGFDLFRKMITIPEYVYHQGNKLVPDNIIHSKPDSKSNFKPTI